MWILFVASSYFAQKNAARNVLAREFFRYVRMRSRILSVRSVRSRFLLKINESSDKATAVSEERAHTKLA